MKQVLPVCDIKQMVFFGGGGGRGMFPASELPGPHIHKVRFTSCRCTVETNLSNNQTKSDSSLLVIPLFLEDRHFCNAQLLLMKPNAQFLTVHCHRRTVHDQSRYSFFHAVSEILDSTYKMLTFQYSAKSLQC